MGRLLRYKEVETVSMQDELKSNTAEDTLTYGESISLTRDGELVPAIMLAKGDAVTLDPRDRKSVV